MPDATFHTSYSPVPDPTPEEKLKYFRDLFQKVLSVAQQRKATTIWKNKPTHERNKEFATLLEPLMPKIDKLTGQENDVRYFGYALEWVFESYKGNPFPR